MSFSFRGVFVLAAAAISLGGCATPVQQRIDLADNYFASGKAKQGKMGVVMVELPKPGKDTGIRFYGDNSSCRSKMDINAAYQQLLEQTSWVYITPNTS